MVERHATSRRNYRASRPLDPDRLNDLALSYASRYATSAGKLESYLKRKLRERGWDGEESEGGRYIEAIIERFVDKGYVDDRGYGQMKAGGLLARGYGPRRIEETLRSAGLDEVLRSALAPGEYEARKAAIALAKRRRFGPFGSSGDDEPIELRHKRREKQLAAMIRAGHMFEHTQAILSADSEDALESWLEEAESQE